MLFKALLVFSHFRRFHRFSVLSIFSGLRFRPARASEIEKNHRPGPMWKVETSLISVVKLWNNNFYIFQFSKHLLTIYGFVAFFSDDLRFCRTPEFFFQNSVSVRATQSQSGESDFVGSISKIFSFLFDPQNVHRLGKNFNFLTVSLVCSK